MFLIYLFIFFLIKNISNRISEHDNRNLIQNYGEYFGRVNTYLNSEKKNKNLISSLKGFGKRFIPNSPVYNHDWIFSNESSPVHPDRSITHRDYRGWPPLDNPQSRSILITNRKKSSGNWMTSCYDDYGRNSERVPSELIYRDDYKRIPIHPWHY
jgi:hypothetical protein